MSNSTGVGKEKNVTASAAILFGVAAIQMVMEWDWVFYVRPGDGGD